MRGLTGVSRGDILTYANSTTQQGIHPDWVIGTLEISDDIHRVSDAPITSVDIGYRAGGTDPLTFRLRFYEFEGPYGTFPPPLLAEYSFPDLPATLGNHFAHLELPAPLTVPADIWVGFHFSDSAAGLAYWPPSVGSTNDYWLRDYDLDGVAETLENDSGLDALYLNICSVPEPQTGILCAATAAWVICMTRRRA